jgi:hypothetical protein
MNDIFKPIYKHRVGIEATSLELSELTSRAGQLFLVLFINTLDDFTVVVDLLESLFCLAVRAVSTHGLQYLPNYLKE